MLRLRRYRVFLFFAVFTVFAFYKFSGSSQWQHSSFDPSPIPNKLKPHAEDIEESATEVDQLPKPALNEVVKETKKLDVHVPAAETPQGPLVTPPPVAQVDKPTPSPGPLSKKPSKVDDGRPLEVPKVPEQGPVPGNLPHEGGVGEFEQFSDPETIPPVHWSKQKEHFPVPTESIIGLPKASPITIPKIQYAFKKETADQKTSREARLSEVKKEFLWAWNGYKEHAWLHDELKPVTGEYKDPFAGWGATLVDTLDTLWIMGLTEEFEAAVEGVMKIDFTTTKRDDIPVFETTIRYLGGLLAAYDVSEGKYKALLDKAVELAEILMGIFDTPNRMPVLYYHWQPSFASNPHRASTSSVLAEIGSLSMEFTRLAQLTKEPKYYDAIARITNELEKSQNNTRLPGMWPTNLDASGCKKFDPTQNLGSPSTAENPGTDRLQNQTPVTDGAVSTSDETLTKEDEKMIPDDQKMIPFKRPPPVEFTAKEAEEDTPSTPQAGKAGRIQGFDGETVDETSLQRPKPQQHPGPPKDKNPNTPQAGKAGSILGMNGENVDETSLGRLSKPGDVKPNTMSREDDVPDAKLEKNPIAAGAGKLTEMLGMDGSEDKGDGTKLKSDPRLPVQEKPLRVQDWDDDGKKEDIFKPLTPGQPGKVAGWNEREEEISGLRKRQLDLEEQPSFEELVVGVERPTPPPVTESTLEANDKDAPDCIPQGLVPTVSWGRNTFTLGGLSDSTYEYLPKQYLLLGGVVDQYKTMYESAMEAIRKYLIFRPMLPHGLDVLMSGAFSISGKVGAVDVDDGELDPEGAHLTCFVGGMIGMGAKIFGIESDLKLAEKLTEGCVWAYNTTASGIMPESFRAIPCDDPKDCTWNQTQYFEEIDPHHESRQISYLKGLDQYSMQLEEAKAKATAAVELIKEAAKTAASNPAIPTLSPGVEAPVAPADPAFPADPATPPKPNPPETPDALKKRQLDLDREEPEMSDEAKAELADIPTDPYVREYKLLTKFITPPSKPLTHEERVTQIREEDGIPLGMKSVSGRAYILRPEAIESVWYMYRITGNEHWRDVGWNMFESIIKHTRSEYGHSAINDILQAKTTQSDSMESFWLAETLKYFYLLYSEESLISLDEWVLNTEAHPLRRPLPEKTAA